MSQQLKREIVTSGKKVAHSGYYVYAGHAVEAENNQGCTVIDKANTGIYFAKGSIAPSLMTCPHKVNWALDD
ncbi:MAG: hypothetical protein ACREBB_09210 [Nitrosotalea sp.]